MNHSEYEKMASKLDAIYKSKQATSEPPPHFDDIPPIGASTAPGIDKAVILTCGASLTPEPVCWLWKHWLALGKFHLLAGAPGQGKTTIAMGMAATVTIGGRWPDGTHCDAGNILIWSGEDDYRDTLLPRLIGAGANLNRVFFVDCTRVGDEVRPFDPASDTRTLLQAVEAIGGVRLIVIDPVSTAIQGDSHKNSEVRRGLQPLVDLAETAKAAVLGITHLSKAGQGIDPAQRVIGSIAFTAVARVVMLAARVKGADGDDDKRILARGKSNIGPDNGGFEYHLKQVEALPGIEASRVEWGQAVDGTARELLTDPCADSDGGDEDHNDILEMLKAELTADCWTPSEQVTKSLKGEGFSIDQIKRAKKKLGVISKKGGMQDGWYLRMPGGYAAEECDFPTKSAKSAPLFKAHSSHSSAHSSVESHSSAVDGDCW